MIIILNGNNPIAFFQGNMTQTDILLTCTIKIPSKSVMCSTPIILVFMNFNIFYVGHLGHIPEAA